MAWWPQLLWEQFFCLSGPFHLSEFRSPLTEPFMGPSHEYKVRIRDYHFTTHIAYYSFFQAGSSLLHRYTVFIASTTVLLSRFRRKCSLTIVSTVELVSKELNHFGVIADLFRQIGGHSSRFVLFCSF